MYRNSRILVFSGFSLRFIDLKYQKTVQYGMTLAKKTILRIWNRAHTFETLLLEFSSVLHMEKIRYEIAAGIYC